MAGDKMQLPESFEAAAMKLRDLASQQLGEGETMGSLKVDGETALTYAAMLASLWAGGNSSLDEKVIYSLVMSPPFLTAVVMNCLYGLLETGEITRDRIADLSKALMVAGNEH